MLLLSIQFLPTPLTVADIISAVEFDKSGEHLATGDRGGRVVLFERLRPTKTSLELMRAEQERKNGELNQTKKPDPVEYRYLTEFQSHEPEFDYLKSLEIEEKINTLRWCHQGANSSRFLISTNDKTIKLWKVFEKQLQCVSDFNLGEDVKRNGTGGNAGQINAIKPPGTPSKDSSGLGGCNDSSGSFSGSLRMPSCVATDVVFSARCRKQFGNAHAYHINSLSVNSDCETYISADDLRINLWHLERESDAFTIVDIKPENMEDLTEVITSAEFHPSQCNLFAYSSSKGSIRVADMRQNALCHNHVQMFDSPELPGTKSFFSEIIASISDIKFSRDGRFLLSRDYLNLKLWDLRNESQPVNTFQVHEHLRSKLCDLYESDAIFDKFQCCPSGDGSHVATGSYGNQFRSFDSSTGNADTFEVTKDPQRLRRANVSRKRGLSSGGSSLSSSPAGRGGFLSSSPRSMSNQSSASQLLGASASPTQPDFNTKIPHMAWHPQENVVACAASNSLYIFNA